MVRILSVVGAFLTVVLVVFLGWYFRPWSEYSPHEVLQSQKVEDRTVFYRQMETLYPYRQISASPQVENLSRN
ncbi:MAG: hypothetical protein AAF723_11275, partial [Pseudomonadota bacterium]